MELVKAVPGLLTVTSNPFHLPVDTSANIVPPKLPPSSSEITSSSPSLVQGMQLLNIPEPPILLQADHPDAKFWTKSEWRDHLSSEAGISTGMRGKRGRSRAASNINVRMLYVTGVDGKPVNGHRAGDMRKTGRAAWATIRDCGLATQKFLQLQGIARDYFRRIMARTHPEFLLCENGWKADQMAIDNYSQWYRVHGKTMQNESRESDDGEDGEDEDDGEDEVTEDKNEDAEDKGEDPEDEDQIVDKNNAQAQDWNEDNDENLNQAKDKDQNDLEDHAHRDFAMGIDDEEALDLMLSDTQHDEDLGLDDLDVRHRNRKRGGPSSTFDGSATMTKRQRREVCPVTVSLSLFIWSYLRISYAQVVNPLLGLRISVTETPPPILRTRTISRAPASDSGDIDKALPPSIDQQPMNVTGGVGSTPPPTNVASPKRNHQPASIEPNGKPEKRWQRKERVPYAVPTTREGPKYVVLLVLDQSNIWPSFF